MMILTLSERIKAVRRMRNLTQEQVATAMGIKREQYRRYENGINEMSVSKFIYLCRILDVSSDFLLNL